MWFTKAKYRVQTLLPMLVDVEVDCAVNIIVMVVEG